MVTCRLLSVDQAQVILGCRKRVPLGWYAWASRWWLRADARLCGVFYYRVEVLPLP